MAGNPLAKLLPYVKKYAVEIYLGIGIYAAISHQMNLNKTYRSVYSKFDFQRVHHMEKLRNYVQKSNPQV